MKGYIAPERDSVRGWRFWMAFLPLLLVASCTAQESVGLKSNFAPGARVVLDAHNCYPYDGKYKNRIDRALAMGFPVSIEIDLAWHSEPGRSRSVVSHETKTKGDEPGLEEYFFERVRPLVEKALAEGDSSKWPILYLHFDFKSNEHEHLAYVSKIMAKYRNWLTSSVRVTDESKVQPLLMKPILAITETNDMQKRVFHDEVLPGERFYVFGSAPGENYLPKNAPRERQLEVMSSANPATMLVTPAGNYRRWWNHSWAVVEDGGPSRAGDWTAADKARLKALVDHAHALGYLIRFYTLNGHAVGGGEGWGASYNFGSLGAVSARWKAAYEAGVDFIATDQYEELGKALEEYSKAKKSISAH